MRNNSMRASETIRHMGENMRISALCFVLAAVTSISAMAASLTATAPSGVKTDVAEHSAHNKDCGAEHVVAKLTSPPANGTVTIAEENKVVPSVGKLGGPQSCAGHTMPTAVVYYQSKPNFKGTDRFKYQRTNEDNPSDRLNGEIEIAVTVN
jgi:hypothetical protein